MLFKDGYKEGFSKGFDLGMEEGYLASLQEEAMAVGRSTETSEVKESSGDWDY